MIALDVPGGDFAPVATLSGALQAARRGVPVLLCGSTAEIVHQLDLLDREWQSLPFTLRDAPEVIEMGEHPALAVRNKPNSSLVVAIDAVRSGECTAAVSAGNSGAAMVAALRLLGLQDGIQRPAIAGFLPTRTGRVLVSDLGANVDCKPRYLVQFAELCARMLSESSLNDAGGQRPMHAFRIGILSNGSEPQKGSQLVQEAYALLAQATHLNFVGNIEPAALFAGDADIVVCDGFAGNVLLKTLEAVVALCAASSAHENVHQGQGQNEHFYRTFDWREAGGAQLIGIRGMVVVAHGCSDARAIEQVLVRAHTGMDKHSSLGSIHGASGATRVMRELR